MKCGKKILSSIILSTLCSSAALATNGYAPHGIGMTSKGMGGVYIAHQGDAVAVGGNPAGSAFLSDRFDLGVDIFRPIRDAEINGNGGLGGGDFSFNGSDAKIFALPELGYRRGLNNNMAFGLSVFGNGGMNSDYKNGIPLFNAGSGSRTSINLMQLFVVPSLSFKVNDDHAIGLGLNLVAQGFEARGLQSFDNAGFSAEPGSVTDNGTDWSYGAGVRLGWVGKFGSRLTLGATYQTRTYMTEYDEYAGLFAEQGDFDVPSNYGVGVAFQATPKLLIAADVMRINYEEIDAISNSGAIPAQLGSDGGPGFGWEDMTVYKLGVEFQVNPDLTLRAGYNHGSAPIPSNETFFNILAPATVEDHLTLGATWQVNPDMSVTASYMHAFENKINGSNSIAPAFGAGEANISMYQDSFGVAVSWKL